MLSKKASVDIVKTMICSIIDYGNMFIGSCNLQDLFDLQVLQNNALICCYNVNDPRMMHVDNLHTNANMHTIDYRREKQQILCIWRNIQSGYTIPYIPARVTRTGSGITIRLPIPRTELFKESVFYKGSKHWNITELNEFKKKNPALYLN